MSSSPTSAEYLTSPVPAADYEYRVRCRCGGRSVPCLPQRVGDVLDVAFEDADGDCRYWPDGQLAWDGTGWAGLGLRLVCQGRSLRLSDAVPLWSGGSPWQAGFRLRRPAGGCLAVVTAYVVPPTVVYAATLYATSPLRPARGGWVAGAAGAAWLWPESADAAGYVDRRTVAEFVAGDLVVPQVWAGEWSDPARPAERKVVRAGRAVIRRRAGGCRGGCGLPPAPPPT